MVSPGDDLYRRLLARHDIEQALFRYCRGIDRADWDLVRTAFHDDAVDEHGSVNGSVDDLITWTRRRHEAVIQSMHAITNVGFLAEAGDRVETEAYCMVRQTVRRDGKPPANLSIGCRYIDTFTLRDEWRIARRRVRYDWVHRLDVDKEFLSTSPELVMSARDASDPIYEAAARPG
jgi:SnoaL-like domain